MLTRIISALIGIPLLIFIISKGGIILTLSLFIVSLIGLNEFYNAFNKLEIFPIKYVSYLFTLSLYFIYITNNDYLYNLNFYLITLVLLIINLFSKKNNLINVSITLIGYLYISFTLIHIIFLSDEYKSFVWLIFIIAMSTDTFAYFSGYFFGSKKLIPSVSPKKTIEGSVGGIIGSLLLTIVFTYFFIPNFMLHSIILGISGSVLSQIGDLIASKIKRYAGIKDFGNLIPGHGGIIDRFDSIIILSPFIYYYIKIFL